VCTWQAVCLTVLQLMVITEHNRMDRIKIKKIMFMFILHECNQFHSEGLKWHVGYTLSAHALKEGWKAQICNKTSYIKKNIYMYNNNNNNKIKKTSVW
jgi:hypothetical protein